jgi:hypothetical protein
MCLGVVRRSGGRRGNVTPASEVPCCCLAAHSGPSEKPESLDDGLARFLGRKLLRLLVRDEDVCAFIVVFGCLL